MSLQSELAPSLTIWEQMQGQAVSPIIAKVSLAGDCGAGAIPPHFP